MTEQTKKAILYSTILIIGIITISILVSWFTYKNTKSGNNIEQAKKVSLQFLKTATNLKKDYQLTQESYQQKTLIQNTLFSQACQSNSEITSKDLNKIVSCLKLPEVNENGYYISRLVLSEGTNIKLKKVEEKNNLVHLYYSLDIKIREMTIPGSDTEVPKPVFQNKTIHIEEVRITVKDGLVNSTDAKQTLKNWSYFWNGQNILLEDNSNGK